jgi:hypothetical protein
MEVVFQQQQEDLVVQEVEVDLAEQQEQETVHQLVRHKETLEE